MVKKLIVIAFMLTSISLVAADKDETVKNIRDKIKEYNLALNGKNWKDALNKVTMISMELDDAKEGDFLSELDKELSNEFQRLESDKYLFMIETHAKILQALDTYKKALEKNDFASAKSQVTELSNLFDDVKDDNEVLTIIQQTLKKSAIDFNEETIEALAEALDQESAQKAEDTKKDAKESAAPYGGSASSAKQPEQDKAKANRGGAAPAQPKPATAAQGAVTLITDKAEFDLVVAALTNVFEDAKKADTTIIKQIKGNTAAKSQLINAGDQIKPVIGQVEGENTTFKRAQASAKTLGATKEQEAQLKAISDTVPQFKADVIGIDKAAAAAA